MVSRHSLEKCSGVHGDAGGVLHQRHQHPGGGERAGSRADLRHSLRGHVPQPVGAVGACGWVWEGPEKSVIAAISHSDISRLRRALVALVGHPASSCSPHGDARVTWSGTFYP